MIVNVILATVPIGSCSGEVAVLAGREKGVATFTENTEQPSDRLLTTAGPFTFNRFRIFRKEGSCGIAGTGVRGCFHRLILSLSTTSLTFCFTRFTRCCYRRGGSRQRVLGLLCRSFHTLRGDECSGRLIHTIFRLGTVAVGKRKPRIFTYVRYRTGRSLYFFSIGEKNVFYEAYTGRMRNVCVSSSAQCAVRCVVSAPITELCSFAISRRMLERLGVVVGRCVTCCIRRSFGSLSVFN